MFLINNLKEGACFRALFFKRCSYLAFCLNPPKRVRFLWFFCKNPLNVVDKRGRFCYNKKCEYFSTKRFEGNVEIGKRTNDGRARDDRVPESGGHKGYIRISGRGDLSVLR